MPEIKDITEGHTNTVLIPTPTCPVCGHPGALEATVEEGLNFHVGRRVAEVFPTRSADYREQIISGTHPDCWDLLFAGEDD